MLEKFQLDGKTAVVTGAGRGIGAAIAVGFAQAGADVVITARTEDELGRVADQVTSTGRRAIAVPLDLAKDDPRILVERAVAETGRVDIVVNNVGGAPPKTFLDTSVANLERAFAFNVGTAHALNLAAVPVMLAGDGGSIINITSSMGRLAGRAFLAYGTSKAALAHYTRLAAEDLAPKIRVNAIAPGSVLTSALEYVAGDDAMRAEIESNTPLRRLGDADEIAAAAVYLAGPAAGYLTGKVIEVDGGLEAPNVALPVPDL